MPASQPVLLTHGAWQTAHGGIARLCRCGYLRPVPLPSRTDQFAHAELPPACHHGVSASRHVHRMPLQIIEAAFPLPRSVCFYELGKVAIPPDGQPGMRGGRASEPMVHSAVSPCRNWTYEGRPSRPQRRTHWVVMRQCGAVARLVKIPMWRWQLSALPEHSISGATGAGD